MTTLLNASWLAGCRMLYGNNTDGLVNQYGKAVPVYDNITTWGINREACYKYCGPDKLQQTFDFATFSSAFTSWLLPWLALTAQLPFETPTSRSNSMSGLLAIGSPALITYSLSLTILNRTCIRRRFDNLQADAADIAKRYPEFSERVKAAQFLLQEAQQVPMRASQEAGWLSSLIVLPKNQRWWIRVRTDLRNTRRGVTFSLFAQVGMAIIAWIFTIIAAFVGDLGDTNTARLISSGCMWVWMIPVICGWILVGTQYRAGSIQRALKDPNNHACRAEPDLDPNTNMPSDFVGQQQAIANRSGLTPQSHRMTIPLQPGAAGTATPANTPGIGRVGTNDYDQITVPTWIGFSVAGDEEEEGPIYNYARIFTYSQFTGAMESAFKLTLNSLRSGKNCSGKPWDSLQHLGNNLRGTESEVTSFCGIGTYSVSAYPEWSKIRSDIWFEMIIAGTAAVWVQWGSTGPATMIAYLTPTKGLGCRTGSYLVYGVLGTSAWLLLVTSMLFSHAAMLRYQHVHTTTPHINLKENSNHNGNYKRPLSHSLICVAAVTTRVLGKFLAAINALWLVASSIFEYAGLYETCWCETNSPGMGKDGWLVLFKTAQNLEDSARNYWIGGIIFSAGANLLAFAFFYLSCHMKNDD